MVLRGTHIEIKRRTPPHALWSKMYIRVSNGVLGVFCPMFIFPIPINQVGQQSVAMQFQLCKVCTVK